MLISSWLTSVRNRLQSGSRLTKRRYSHKPQRRSAEELEIRSLLTTLVGVRPNVGTFLTEGEIRNVAPQELTLQFSLGEDLDAATVSSQSISVVRSGTDGLFGNGNDVPITIGYVGLGNVTNEVIVRFGENLPDDKYRILVRGSGGSPLRTVGGAAFNSGIDKTFDFELDLGAQVVAVVPQPVTTNSNGTVTQARNQIVVYFNNDDLNPAEAQNPAF